MEQKNKPYRSAGWQSPKDSISIDTLNYGKIPPQAIEAEEAVIAAIMLEEAAYYKVANIISDESFYKEEHRIIFSTIAAMAANSRKIDLMTVTIKLKEEGLLEQVGGPLFITQLTDKVASSAHIVEHARIISDKYVHRLAIVEASRLIHSAYHDSSDEFFATYQSVTQSIDNAMVGVSGMRKISDIMIDVAARLEEREELARQNKMYGINTGSRELNYMTNGWNKGDLVVVGARPSMGKTAIALNLFARRAAERGAHVCVFSLEMEDISLGERLALSYGGIDVDHFRKGRMTEPEWTQFHQSLRQIQKLNLYIDHNSKASVTYIRAVCNNKWRKKECDLVVIDYLQLVESMADKKYGSSREREIAEISSGLKKIARDLKVPVLLLCQLNRSLENREDKRPRLADLRESGSIEQDADVVIFPWRPALYGLTDDNGDSLQGIMSIELAKQRNGRTGTVNIRHTPDMTMFYDLDESFEAVILQSFTEPGEKEGVPY